MGYSADKSPLIGHLAGPLRRLEPLVAQRQEKCGPNRPTPTGVFMQQRPDEALGGDSGHPQNLRKSAKPRAVLNTAQNKLQSAFKTATALVESTRAALMLHLQVATLKAEDLLAAVNARRTLLGLSSIPELTADTKLDAGLSGAAKPSDFNRESALRDLKALSDAAKGFSDLGRGGSIRNCRAPNEAGAGPPHCSRPCSAVLSLSAVSNLSTAPYAPCATRPGRATSICAPT